MTEGYVQPELPLELPTTQHETCTARDAFNEGTCDQRAIAEVRLVCDHGHERNGFTCSAHLAAIEYTLCETCAQLPEGRHQCRAHLAGVERREAPSDVAHVPPIQRGTVQP